MCRLFALVAPEPVEAAPWLFDAELSLLVQSGIDPEHPQGEGWGIAWYPTTGSTAPEVVRGTEGAHTAQERPRFVAAARRAAGPLVVGHLRKASNPRNLPRELLVRPENTQPFVEGPVTFAHNGWISLPPGLEGRMGPRAARIRGTNDSEVLFQLVQLQRERGAPFPSALAGAAREVLASWEAGGRPGNGPYGGLNLVVATGPRELWATCWYDGEHGPCLSGLPRPYYELSWRREGSAVVVLSEPTDRDLSRWSRVPRGTFLHVVSEGGSVRVEQGPLDGLPPYPSGAVASEG